MRRRSLVLLLAVVLAACKTTEEREADFGRAYNYFVDKSSDELVLRLGVPSSTFTLSTGERIFEYRKSERYRSGGYSYTAWRPMKIDGKTVNVPSERYVPGSIHVSHCRLSFTVSEQNMVKAWRWNGDGCY